MPLRCRDRTASSTQPTTPPVSRIRMRRLCVPDVVAPHSYSVVNYFVDTETRSLVRGVGAAHNIGGDKLCSNFSFWVFFVIAYHTMDMHLRRHIASNRGQRSRQGSSTESCSAWLTRGSSTRSQTQPMPIRVDRHIKSRITAVLDSTTGLPPPSILGVGTRRIRYRPEPSSCALPTPGWWPGSSIDGRSSSGCAARFSSAPVTTHA